VPRLIEAPTDEAIDLETLVDQLETEAFDPRDEDEFAAWGTALKKLANNRDFLADMMIAELKQRCDGQVHGNQYSAQVIMLHTSSQRYFMRANLWPAEADTVVRQSGTDPFFYGVPHDHNFSFLTVGYLGPGYWSDYYEYDYDQVTGFPGEEVDLHFVEKTRLDQGKVMLYRAHRDVHLQLPADSLSVSLNIVETSHGTTFRDQYRFDTQSSTVAGIMTRTSLEPMLMLAAHHGGGNGADLLDNFSASHPSDRVRWAAIRAQATAAPTLEGRMGVLERGARDPNRLVAEMARAALAKLQEGRSWIEAVPMLEAAA
jgi:hypothetical protein